MYIDKITIKAISDSYDDKGKISIKENALFEFKDGLSAKDLTKFLENLPDLSHKFCGNVTVNVTINTCEEQWQH